MWQSLLIAFLDGLIVVGAPVSAATTSTTDTRSLSFSFPERWRAIIASFHISINCIVGSIEVAASVASANSLFGIGDCSESKETGDCEEPFHFNLHLPFDLLYPVLGTMANGNVPAIYDPLHKAIRSGAGFDLGYASTTLWRWAPTYLQISGCRGHHR